MYIRIKGQGSWFWNSGYDTNRLIFLYSKINSGKTQTSKETQD